MVRVWMFAVLVLGACAGPVTEEEEEASSASRQQESARSVVGEHLEVIAVNPTELGSKNASNMAQSVDSGSDYDYKLDAGKVYEVRSSGDPRLCGLFTFSNSKQSISFKTLSDPCTRLRPFYQASGAGGHSQSFSSNERLELDEKVGKLHVTGQDTKKYQVSWNDDTHGTLTHSARSCAFEVQQDAIAIEGAAECGLAANYTLASSSKPASK